MDRRRFMKGCFVAGAAVVLSPALKGREFFARALAEEKLVPLSEKDPMAVSMGYYVSADKVDTKKWAKKAGADGKTQTCGNCSFFTAAGAGTGKCQIFPGKSVATKGWCNTWNKKA